MDTHKTENHRIKKRKIPKRRQNRLPERTKRDSQRQNLAETRRQTRRSAQRRNLQENNPHSKQPRRSRSLHQTNLPPDPRNLHHIRVRTRRRTITHIGNKYPKENSRGLSRLNRSYHFTYRSTHNIASITMYRTFFPIRRPLINWRIWKTHQSIYIVR
jgi:hypothetical protein